MSEPYDISLEISRKCKLDEPEFTDAEKEHLQKLLIEWYTTKVMLWHDDALAKEAVDMGVVL
jgi:hypothetical protein